MTLKPHHLIAHANAMEINLDQWLKADRPEVNPMDPKALTLAVHSLGKITYGGYLEDRSYIWRNSYLSKEKKFTHLGIDVNVPAGTAVFLPFGAKVVDVWADPDTEIGWGGRVILQRHKGTPFIILAHLNPARLDHLKVGESTNPDNPIGWVGTWPGNGNVFEHLHIQLADASLGDQLREIDGYGYPEDTDKFPDPFGTDL